MSKCPKCGQEVSSKFCPDCGINVAEPPKCPKCGAVMTGRFCPDCGYDSATKNKEPNKFVEKTNGVFGKIKEKTVSVFNKCKEFFLANKQKCIIIGTTAIVSLVLLIVLIATLTNIFRVGKVSKIEIGMSMSEVEKILGEPTLDDEGNWYWYEKKVAKKLKKAEKIEEEFEYIEDEDDFEKFEEKYDKIYAEIEEMTYKFIMVKFDGDDKVQEVFFDKHHKYDDSDDYLSEEEKKVKKLELSIDSFEGYTETTNGETVAHLVSNPNKITYSVKFEDGSYCLNTIYQSSMEFSVDGNKCKVKWLDNIANYETTKPFNATGTILDGVLTSWNTTAENVVLPESVKDIGTALKGNTTMKQITLPTGITAIKAEAFMGCSALENIEFPNSVTTIGERAFDGCSSLSRLVINENITSIEQNAFNNCYILYEIVNRSNLNIKKGSIEHGSIARNAIIVHNDLNSTLESTQEGLFFLCSEKDIVLIAYKNSATNIVLPESYKDLTYAIMPNIFKGNDQITSISIPSFLTEIEKGMFNDCAALESITVSEENPNYKSIDGNLYSKDGKSLVQYAIGKKQTSFEIPTSVDTILFGAFKGCKSLTEIIIGDNVITIESKAFKECEKLQTLNIGQNVTTLGVDAFSDCSALQKVVFNATNLKSFIFDLNIFDQIFDASNEVEKQNKLEEFSNSLEFVDSDSPYYEFLIDINHILNDMHNGEIMDFEIHKTLNEFKANMRWFKDSGKNMEIVIGPNATAIPEYLFADSEVKTIISSSESSCEYIKEGAFANCYLLTSVTIPNGVKTIGASAFIGCSLLESITIPYSLTLIEKDAFYFCDLITNINYLGTIEQWCYISFSNQFSNPLCGAAGKLYANGTLITDIVIPNTVRKINAYAFYDYKSLTNVTIPNSVTEIGFCAFGGCSSLTNITIPNSVKTIEGSAFRYCKSLTSVTISNSVKTIGDYAFYDCDSLTSVIIGSYVTEIGDYAFSGCNSLTSIIIPDSVTSIGDYAFHYCKSLTIYCKAGSKPDGWGTLWNESIRPVYWYSENEPTTSGNYWHYDDNYEIIIW